MIRVVVADDHPMVRYGIAAVLADVASIELVGEASSGEELLSLVNRLRPDVVLTDLSMPGMGGIEAIAHLGGVACLALTMHADDETVFAALRAGARGYLIKGADGAELVRAIESVAAGEAVYGAAVANRIVAFLTGSEKRTFPDLTGRETEVLELLAAGMKNHAIADRLGLSEKTVRNHVSAVLLKLQVPDRTAAALKARDAGLGR
jgi:DNA-binding NarL/FixJ family response regulator